MLKKIISSALATFLLLSSIPFTYAFAAFTDTDKISDWAAQHVDYCVERGLLIGYPDGSFSPKGYVTHKEIAIIANRIVPGFSNEALAVKTPITRADAAGVIAKLLTVAEDSDNRSKLVLRFASGEFKPYDDLGGITDTATISAILMLYEESIMVGHGRKFRPNAPITREELTKILHLITT